MKALLILFPLALAAQYRIVYPLSVVPGGIDAATVNEHVTRTEDFFRYAVLRGGRYYVQYTQEGATGWSSETKNIPRGTECYIDRHGTIRRSRCGNELSRTPRLPHLTAPLPPDKELETPRIVEITPPDVIPPHLPLIAHLLPPDLPIFVSRPDAPPEFPEIMPPITIRPNSPAPYLIPPTVGIPVGFVPPVAVVVPEPRYGGILLGLVICGAICWLIKKFRLKDTDKND